MVSLFSSWRVVESISSSFRLTLNVFGLLVTRYLETWTYVCLEIVLLLEALEGQ